VKGAAEDEQPSSPYWRTLQHLIDRAETIELSLLDKDVPQKKWLQSEVAWIVVDLALLRQELPAQQETQELFWQTIDRTGFAPVALALGLGNLHFLLMSYPPVASQQTEHDEVLASIAAWLPSKN
jgi:hypothetical protein